MIDDFERRLVEHLSHLLGAWPPLRRLTIVESRRRTAPTWDGKVRPIVGVSSPAGTVLSVPPGVADAARALLDGGEDLARLAGTIGALVGEPALRLDTAVFQYLVQLVDVETLGEWLDPSDPRVPEWLRPFNAEVLVYFDESGQCAAGVGRKVHDRWGQELAVVTAPAYRRRGLAARLVATAARRVYDEGAIATYIHRADNQPSAAVAKAAGFSDGWPIHGLPRRRDA